LLVSIARTNRNTAAAAAAAEEEEDLRLLLLLYAVLLLPLVHSSPLYPLGPPPDAPAVVVVANTSKWPPATPAKSQDHHNTAKPTASLIS
jgi:hypothetical protein